MKSITIESNSKKGLNQSSPSSIKHSTSKNKMLSGEPWKQCRTIKLHPCGRTAGCVCACVSSPEHLLRCKCAWRRVSLNGVSVCSVNVCTLRVGRCTIHTQLSTFPPISSKVLYYNTARFHVIMHYYYSRFLSLLLSDCIILFSMQLLCGYCSVVLLLHVCSRVTWLLHVIIERKYSVFGRVHDNYWIVNNVATC